MNNLFALRGKMQELYARYTIVFDKLIQFILALLVFYQINNHIGFMDILAQPVVTVGLAGVCAVFPMLITVLLAAAVVLLHIYTASLGIFIAVAVLFLIMFVFYFRLTPKKSVVLLVTPLAFMFNIPCVVPVICALFMGPIAIVAIICGTIVYYVLGYVKMSLPLLQGGDAASLTTEISAFVKQVFQNKQLLIVIAAMVITYLCVYSIRRMAIDHAWKIAIAVGAVVNVVIIVAGNIALGEMTDFVTLIVGTFFAVVLGIVLEFFFFSVDYQKSENLQFEDDEYYYYVKAVPKLVVTSQEKTIKKITERRVIELEEQEEKTEPDVTETISVQETLETKGRLVPRKGPKTIEIKIIKDLKSDLEIKE